MDRLRSVALTLAGLVGTAGLLVLGGHYGWVVVLQWEFPYCVNNFVFAPGCFALAAVGAAVGAFLGLAVASALFLGVVAARRVQVRGRD